MTYEEKARQIGRIVDVKNQQYGNSINDTEGFLKLLYPKGIPIEEYRNLGLLVRIWDKLKRIANGNKGDEDAWADLTGYGLLGISGAFRKDPRPVTLKEKFPISIPSEECSDSGWCTFDE